MSGSTSNKVIKQALAELRDTRKDTRRTAVMKLGMIGGDEAVRNLIWLTENSNEDLIVRARAAMMLGKLGDARAVDALIHALDAPGFQTPFYAAKSLGELGDPRAIQPLVVVAQNTTGKTQAAALQALSQLGYALDDESEPEMS